MIAVTLKRLAALEARPPKRRQSDGTKWEDELISQSGMSREEIIDKYETLANYGYRKFMDEVRSTPSKPLPPEYTSHAEHYRAMVKGEA